jgi:(1->4)-alpha-D-glucan 1-alpha-D-glucosylmutase
VAVVGLPGLYNSLAQVVLKATAPGVPDIYQGTELWDLSLVDPDNRRPVDYQRRRDLLAELDRRAEVEGAALFASLLDQPADGAVKLLVMARALRHRRRHLALFEKGGYAPLAADGPRRHHLVAFARGGGTAGMSITVVGRSFTALSAADRPPVGHGIWGETRLILDRSSPGGDWRDAITGQIVHPAADGERVLRMDEVFASLPAAILVPAG